MLTASGGGGENRSMSLRHTKSMIKFGGTSEKSDGWTRSADRTTLDRRIVDLISTQ